MRIPEAIKKTTIYPEGDKDFMTDYVGVTLFIRWMDGTVTTYTFGDAYHDRGVTKADAMIDAFLLVNPDLELVRLKKNES